MSPASPVPASIILRPLESWALPSDLTDLPSWLVLQETGARAAEDSAELTARAGAGVISYRGEAP